MTLLHQNSVFLRHIIQIYGCRFRCLQAIAEFEEQKSLTPMQITTSYFKLSTDKDVMNRNCLCGTSEHLIIENAFSILGQTNKKSRQFGTMCGKIPQGWDGKPCQFDYMIFHWETSTKDGHYTLGDRNGVEIFDPWDASESKIDKIKILRKLLYKVWRK